MEELDNSYCYIVDQLCRICAIYVLFKVLLKLWQLITEYVIPRFKEPADFKHYGQWAVITGSTDGVGKGFALELAKRGVDICLIARNEEKLRNTAKEIEHSGVKTKCIAADFTNPQIYDNIKEKLASLDIGILVNNVGIMNKPLMEFDSHDQQFLKDIINVNILSAVMMTSIISPSMINKKRGLIINISSTAGENIMPYMTMYSTTKGFMTALGTSLSYELKKNNILVKTYIPGGIHTNLLHQNRKIGSKESANTTFIISVQQFVESALMSINSGNIKSCGHFTHEISLMLIGMCPIWLRRKVLKHLYEPKLKQM